MTPHPIFLTFAEVIEIHDYQISRFGGAASVRDVGLLTSALAMPSATFDGEYLHPSIIEMAAAYLYHLVADHPFVDGNKRVGAMAALIFLDLNGYEFAASDADFTAMVLRVASGETLKADVAVFFRRHAQPR